MTTVPNQLVTQQVRIPALAGDVIGMHYGVGASPDCGRSLAGYTYIGGNGDVQSGPLSGFSGGGFQFSVRATLEPDADGDGFGDVSQDDCPSSAQTQGTCPAPSTTITKAKVNQRRDRVKVFFTSSIPGSTFRCAVDSARLKPCTSPFVRTLRPGKHSIGVQATSPAGQTDQSPAVVKLRVN